MAGDKKDIPEWQRNSAPTPSESELDAEQKSRPSKEEKKDNGNVATKSREDLLEQARTFLAHEEIRDASTESKISFLEEKGLTNDEIQQLLGVSRNETKATAAEGVLEHSQQHSSSATGDGPAIAASTAADSSPSPPPIITYPEFLVHASKPPPLVTPARALKAVYAASLLGTGIYGASKFILQPMFDSLSDARHELFGVAKEQLEPLNKKLEGLVSTIPPMPSDRSSSTNVGHERRREKTRDGEEEDEEDDEGSSVASDPTEMFHRDIAVQTSPPSSPSLSGVSDEEVEKSTPTGLAAKRLASLREHLDSLLQASSAVLESSDAAKEAVRNTEVYLDQVRYGDGAGSGLTGMGDEAWRSQIFGAKVAGAKKTDAVDDLKSDIRALKGAMLSARNFPRGVK